jgi:hypothetical protein
MNFEEMNFEDAEEGEGAAMGVTGGAAARARLTLKDGDDDRVPYEEVAEGAVERDGPGTGRKPEERKLTTYLVGMGIHEARAAGYAATLVAKGCNTPDDLDRLGLAELGDDIKMKTGHIKKVAKHRAVHGAAVPSAATHWPDGRKKIVGQARPAVTGTPSFGWVGRLAHVLGRFANALSGWVG